MNLRIQLSSGTGMTKFLVGKQATLLSPSTTLSLACKLHIFDYQEILEKIKKFHKEKIGKNASDSEFKNEIEEEINSVLKLNQTSSSEIFFNKKHIKQVMKNSHKSSAPGPD